MSDLDRGAYTPPTDASLSFDPREPVRGARPIPFTLIVAILVLLGLAAAIFVFYRQGARQAGQPPQAVGAPLSNIKAPPPPEAQPQDPAAGLQIYQAENGPPAPSKDVQFAPPPEQPQARAPAGAAPPLRPAIAAEPPAAAHPTAPIAAVPIAKAAPPPAAPVAPAPAPKVEKPAAKAPQPAPAKAAPVKAATAKAPPAPARPAAGAASVQIGAFSSQALADKGWSAATAVAPGAAAGKGKSVEKVEKDGHTFFRTQVTGFASRADASAFCARLKAAGKACFVK